MFIAEDRKIGRSEGADSPPCSDEHLGQHPFSGSCGQLMRESRVVVVSVRRGDEVVEKLILASSQQVLRCGNHVSIFFKRRGFFCPQSLSFSPILTSCFFFSGSMCFRGLYRSTGNKTFMVAAKAV